MIKAGYDALTVGDKKPTFNEFIKATIEATSREKVAEAFNAIKESWIRNKLLETDFDKEYVDIFKYRKAIVRPLKDFAVTSLEDNSQKKAEEDYIFESSLNNKLKSKNGWKNNSNGTDEYGWGGLPGGCRAEESGFGNIEGYGFWWTSERCKKNPSTGVPAETHAYRICLEHNDVISFGLLLAKELTFGYSVRCIEED